MDSHEVRKIVREELRALLGQAVETAHEVIGDPRLEALDRYVATRAPGDVPAADLYMAFLAWATVEAPEVGFLTTTAFGRLAARSAGLFRSTRAGRRFYTVRRSGSGCVGAPGCDHPTLKMSDRCAEHQIDGTANRAAA
jgi:hypothetical protein